MKGISDFLNKFKIIPNPKDEKRIVVDIIKEILNKDLEIEEGAIEFKGSVIHIEIHPAIKNVIFQRKIDILEKINTRFNGEKVFKNII